MTVAYGSVTVAGIAQVSDWQPDRLRAGVVLAGCVVGLAGLVVWHPEPTARDLYREHDGEDERSTWPGWRQTVAPVGVAAFFTQLVLKVFGADHHHLVVPQLLAASVLGICLGIGVGSYLRRLWRSRSERWNETGCG